MLAMVHVRLSHPMVRMVKHGIVVHVWFHANWNWTWLCVHVTAYSLHRTTAVLPLLSTALLLGHEQSAEDGTAAKRRHIKRCVSFTL
jgi:hypothetical protein